MKGGVRLLYLPNELKYLGWQKGPRAAFQDMLSQGELEAYETYSFEHEWRVVGKPGQEVLAEILSLAEDFQPTLVIWQHPKDFPVTVEFLQRIKKLSSRPVICYDERDPYGPNRPLPTGGQVLASQADICFSVGFGCFRSELQSAGAKRIEYSPHAADTVQFGQAWEPTISRKNQVLMIASLHRCPRFRRGGRFFSKLIPGNEYRLQLARELHKVLGSSFALYGSGWEGLVPHRGMLPFEDQENACRSAWVTVNWDQFDDVPFYFSDRLPIALLSGVPHVCHYHEGYETVFGNEEFLFFGRTVSQIVDKVLFLLSLPPQDLIKMGARGENFVRQHLTYDVVMRSVVRRAIECRQS